MRQKTTRPASAENHSSELAEAKKSAAILFVRRLMKTPSKEQFDLFYCNSALVNSRRRKPHVEPLPVPPITDYTHDSLCSGVQPPISNIDSDTPKCVDYAPFEVWA